MSSRFVAVAVVLALGAVACAGSGASADGPEGAAARVVYVFDGDSMEVEIDGRTKEVRLLGINAPEGDECFGNEARDALIGLLDGRDLVLVEDPADDTDQYGRLLRYVYIDDENVNGHMLADGSAVTLQGDHRYNDEFVEIGNHAVEAMLGMWAPDACGPAPPPGATIASVEYDPPGPDDERLNDEFVTIRNGGNQPLNVARWILRDESTRNRYEFKGPNLKPGEAVTVRTGCGNDQASTVYWCSDAPIWSNAGDTAILQDGHGSVVDRWTYAGR